MARITRCSLVALLLCLLFLSPANTIAETSTLGPRFFLPESEYDFGVVPQGRVVEREFKVINKGDAELHIQRLVAGCSCTASTVEKDKIAPGESGAIKVAFDTSGFSGSKSKAVRIYTNDSDHPVSYLTLKGVIEPDVVIDPQWLMFGELVREGERVKVAKAVEVRVRSGSEITLEGVKAYSDNIHVEDLQLSPKKATFAVRIDDEAPIGELRDRVVVSLSNYRKKTLQVPVLAEIAGPLRLSPPMVSFGVVEGARRMTRKVKFDNYSSNLVRLTQVESQHPALQAAITEIVEGKRYVIEIQLDPQKVDKDLRTTVEINTDQEDGEPLVLSVYGTKPPRVEP